MIPDIADDALPGYDAISSGLGGMAHGTLCRRGIFHHGALVPKPSNLSYAQAATLTCSGLTAWNALRGCQGRKVKHGDWVLVQGTGGVSIAALQVLVPNFLSLSLGHYCNRHLRFFNYPLSL
jgi:NADPH:quinone reductase-like Zn-dependent oxidoreductase